MLFALIVGLGTALSTQDRRVDKRSAIHRSAWMRGGWRLRLIHPTLLIVGLGIALSAQAAQTLQATEILYRDSVPEQTDGSTRILVADDRLRMDYGRDDGDYVLFDGRAIYLVSMAARTATVIPAGRPRLRGVALEPVALNVRRSGSELLVKVALRDRQCVEIRTAPLLKEEMVMLQFLQQAMAANQAAALLSTPENLRDPCDWALAVQEAGIEYRFGLPLAIRYANGRKRTYRNHAVRQLPAALFELPAGHRRLPIP